MSPDTIVPGAANPQAWNRYSYVLNNPIRYNDPTGHVCSDPDDPTPSCESGNPYPNNTQPLGDDDVVINNPGPLDDGQEQDDPTPTSDPGGGGGHPLLSLSNDITLNCQSNPNCFYASQNALFQQVNAMVGAAIGFGILSALALGFGFGLVFMSPITPLALAGGIVLILAGLYLGVETVDAGLTASYLNTVGTSMSSTQAPMKFDYQQGDAWNKPDLFHSESTSYSHGTFMPITKHIMQNWAAQQQNTNYLWFP